MIICVAHLTIDHRFEIYFSKPAHSYFLVVIRAETHILTAMTDHRYLTELNPRQQEAVLQVDGPLLVLAGAGSGKTKVITHRIAHIIASGKAAPNQIMAVTFTNKAAGEMKSRILNILGPGARGVFMSTFHSFCARVLREFPEPLGFSRSFSIYDSSDTLALIKKIYKDKGIPESQPSHRIAASRISSAKDKLIGPEEYAEEAGDFLDINIATIYREYQKRLVKFQAMDFDDLLTKSVQLFEKNPEILSVFHNRFKYLLVDEYQDTNHVQYRLVNLLARASRNLCVVGDDDQSIYGWRGADINNILDFEKDYPECKVIMLEQNYRSSQNILDAAGDVVAGIRGRKPKRLFTDKAGGEKITLLLCGDEVDEADTISEKIRAGLALDKSAFEFAVLYRTNAQSRVLEDAFRYKGLPYTIVGGIRFYERAEVKDILAYLRLLVNPKDNVALTRIINVPKRGVGKSSIEKLDELAAGKDEPVIALLASSLDQVAIRGKAKAELEKLSVIMTELSSKINELPPHDIAARLIEKIKYLEMLAEENTPEAEVRAENVKELVAGIIEYSERTETPSLNGFLEEVALITDIDTWDEALGSVTLMTLHAAKGLEFDSVFIAGMEDGLIPLKRGFDDSADLDEERRLCYVGMTRAKNKLFLSMAGFRRRWGDYTGGPSLFLKDISKDLLETERFNYWNDYGRPTQKKFNGFSSSGKPKRAPVPAIELDDYDTENTLPVGTVVLHEKFGRGIVTAREGGGEDMMVSVKFERAGVKKLMLKYASLEIISK